ncbi:MAG: alpha-D-ribose 1-methylphosphonate 5-triphosphate diphosphatase, partial [Pseudomonadota bacterium]
RSPEAHLALMQALAARRDEVPSALARLVQDLGPLAFGSHDDADAEARALWGDLGLKIAEFPMSRAAAEAAQARGEPVVLGAPNVVRGGSHVRGGMAAGDLLEDGLVDALASDYHYPSLLAAALGLVDGGMDVAAAWALVSGGPARIMGLTERGGLWPGARADVILVDPVRRRVVGTFAAGRPVFAEGAFAEALIAA